jgi:hypothetical protein
MTVRITVDPGPKTSRASFNAVYFPDDHNYTGFHFEWWVLCFATQRTCGSDNTNTFDRTEHGTFTMTSTSELYSSKISHAITLWGFFIRNGKYYDDDARRARQSAMASQKITAYAEPRERTTGFRPRRHVCISVTTRTSGPGVRQAGRYQSRLLAAQY